GSLDDPRPMRAWMESRRFAAVDGPADRFLFGGDVGGRLAEGHLSLCSVALNPMDGISSLATEGWHKIPRTAVSFPRCQSFAVPYSRDHVVGTGESQCAHCLHEFECRVIAILAAPTPRYTELCVLPALPMD